METICDKYWLLEHDLMTLNSYGMICDQYSLLALICDKYCSWEHDLLQAVVMGTVFVASTGYRNMICDKQ